MASLNKTLLIGNLGKDPEVKYMPNGDAVCNFSVATTESWKDKEGNKQEKVEWHSIVVYRKLAEICGQYLKKGSQVYLEGRLQTRKWQDKETGKDRYMTEIVCDEMKMLGSKQHSEGGGQGSDRPSESRQESPKMYTHKDINGDEFEDDIPFISNNAYCERGMRGIYEF